MMLIARVISREILKDREITDLKPQNPIAPTITMDVPSSSVAPRSSHSISATPPTPRSSSSSVGVPRVLKSMFPWCRDTRQRQDVLLSNQRRQNEKMGIDEFPLLVPPLDDDPIASVSSTDLTAMEATADDADGGSDSEYEEEEGFSDNKDYDE
jgi:hypothetical protein